MKRVYGLLIIILFSCSKKSKNVALILNKWYMVKIEDPSFGKEDDSGSFYGCPFLQFNRDKTFVSFDGISEHTGNWETSDDKILLKTKNDTSKLVIQQLSKSKMEWIVYEKESRIKFYTSTLKPENCSEKE